MSRYRRVHQNDQYSKQKNPNYHVSYNMLGDQIEHKPILTKQPYLDKLRETFDNKVAKKRMTAVCARKMDISVRTLRRFLQGKKIEADTVIKIIKYMKLKHTEL